MTKTMSIRARLVLLSAIGGAGAVAGLLGAAGLYGLQQARLNSEWLEASAVSVRAAMNADMMRDAIRAAVLRAALAAQQGQLDEVRAAEQALTEDFGTLTRDLATAIERAPGAAAVEATEAARPVAERYGASARATVQHLLEAPQDSSVPAGFDTAFHALEGALEHSADAIEASAEEASRASQRFNDRASPAMLAVVSAGLAFLLMSAAGSVDAIASRVRQSADTAREADALAGSASGVAARGGAAVPRVVETMAQIDSSSRRIADIIGVIDGIAFETNILALNAAVEAAGAGEQSSGIGHVNQTVNELDRSTQQNAGLVEQTAAAAQQLAAQAQELSASVSVFRTDGAMA